MLSSVTCKNCSSSASCINLGNGNVQCACPSGYTGNGIRCVKIKYPIEYSCAGKDNGLYCYPKSCCPYYVICNNNETATIQSTNTAICKNDKIANKNECTDYGLECNFPTSTCGDGVCDLIEVGSCTSDCGVLATCGDGICSGTENCYSCKEDCGACETAGGDEDEESDCSISECDVNAICKVTENGMRQCTCKSGYVGNGLECHQKKGCEELDDGTHCYPYNCCPMYMRCKNNKVVEINKYSVDGLVCYDSEEIWAGNALCINEPACDVDRCGNNVCDANEDCLSCPGDCGVCARCGDGVCTGGETCSSCFEDCGYCDVDYTFLPPEQNPCLFNNGGCNENAKCTLGVDNSVVCGCNEGYFGNGKICTKVVNPDDYNCTKKIDGVYCLRNDCCDEYYTCKKGVRGPLYEAPAGKTCYKGYLISESESFCKDSNPKCVPKQTCGDGICFATEIYTCKKDCGEIRCGDGVCSSSENCYSCSRDCRSCKNSDPYPTGLEGKCKTNNGGCSAYANCSIISNGNVQCECNKGFSGSGLYCTNVHNVCWDKKDGRYCYNDNCCSAYYDCINGEPSELKATPPGYVCFNGEAVLSTSDYCYASDNTCNTCGDGICDTYENCKNCYTDCGDCSYCGDNICSEGENCTLCAYDCGICPTVPTEAIVEIVEEEPVNSVLYIIIGSTAGVLLAVIVGIICILKSSRKVVSRTEVL